MSLVFYDTETTGTHTSFDQILQFAAIQTDPELREIERFEVRSRLSQDVVPSWGALRVTGISMAQLLDPALPSHYEMVRRVREKLDAWSPAVFVGYNSLDFDEHLLRHALYRTLHPPYLTNTHGNSRSDALRMVQTVSVYAPDTLTFPVGEKGAPVFKLDQVAAANGFDHRFAHDAVADVQATIFLCRLIAERAPGIWSGFMRFSQKAAVIDFIMNEPIYCLTDFFFGRPYSWLVTTLGGNASNSSEYFVYDLGVDPGSLLSLTQGELVARLAKSPKPVRRLRSNASPILMMADGAASSASGGTLSHDELMRRVETVGPESPLCPRLIAAALAAKEERQPSPYVEEQLYDRFLPTSDEDRMKEFHGTGWEGRLAIVQAFEDERLRELGLRLIHRERPDVLDVATRREQDRAIARRILGHDANAPWLALPKALADAEQMLEASNTAVVEQLAEYQAFCLRIRGAATATLQ